MNAMTRILRHWILLTLQKPGKPFLELSWKARGAFNFLEALREVARRGFGCPIVFRSVFRAQPRNGQTSTV